MAAQGNVPKGAEKIAKRLECSSTTFIQNMKKKKKKKWGARQFVKQIISKHRKMGTSGKKLWWAPNRNQGTSGGLGGLSTSQIT